MADGDKVDPAGEPDTSATSDEPQDPVAESGDTEESAEADENGDGTRDRELVAAGRVSRSASTSADTEPDAGRGRSKKDKATPRQRRGTVERKRTGPITFVRQAVAELRKVVYPTGPQLANYFVVVLIFVLFVIAYVSLLDLGIGALVFRIFA